jgi:GNAT superfamily N-acetyltransferase
MTTAALAVRAMRPAERGAVRDLVRAAFAPYADVFWPELFAEFLADLLDLDAGGPSTTFVAVECDRGERVVGTMRLYPAGGVDAVRLPASWAWALAPAVAPDRLRHGIATALFAECERLAVASGATALCLHTTTFMTATHRLAGRLGFRRAPAWDFDGGVHFGLPAHDLRIVAYGKEIA